MHFGENGNVGSVGKRRILGKKKSFFGGGLSKEEQNKVLQNKTRRR